MSNNQPLQMPSPFIEFESRYHFDKTVEKISLEITSHNWDIVATHDLQKSLNKHDVQVLPIKVMAVCHPNLAKLLLSKDSERIVSSMMPCRISLYEKSDGRTYVSLLNTQMMAGMLGGLVEEVMLKAATEVEKMVECVRKN